MPDPAWERFVEALGREMSRPPRLTSAELARRLEIDEETVANWRRGRSRPPLALLPRIVKAIELGRGLDGRDTFTAPALLREMGALDQDPQDADLIQKALRLQKLELKLEEAHVAAAQAGRLGGASTIVQAAIESGRWAIGVWPAYEGPSDDTQIHVAERIDVMRLGESPDPLRAEDVWNDPLMKSALRATRAVPAAAGPRWANTTTRSVSQWSIMHVGSPRDPTVNAPWPGLGSLCFVSTTLETWVNDVAALVALAIGYGLTSTRDLAMDIYGLSYGQSRPDDRWAIHRGLLREPSRRRVWSHYGTLAKDDASPFGDGRLVRGRSPIFVLLDETDDLITSAWNRWKDSPLTPNLDLALQSRDRYREFAENLPYPNVIRLPTEHFEDRTQRWSQALDQTLRVLNELRQRGVKFSLTELRLVAELGSRREPGVVSPLVNWLGRNGWPEKLDPH